ncbi:hypothetical protein F7725_006044 [Dissostichus mawsoni]|uniref:EF-hand domain-containing protein n=1 Tax=Dissostichus mawsoni TaxID=36200 RepID=A0A7J5YVB9_DISMA|nr:hypothetical protein F7725_006044 [Dissostichus mawsoni]
MLTASPFSIDIPEDQEQLAQAFADIDMDTMRQVVSRGAVGTCTGQFKLCQGTILVIYSYLSPCGDKCTKEGNGFNILEKIRVKVKWTSYAFVFTRVFDKNPGGKVSVSDIKGTLRNLRKVMVDDNIFHCFPGKSIRCIKCFQSQKQAEPDHCRSILPSNTEKNTSTERLSNYFIQQRRPILLAAKMAGLCWMAVVLTFFMSAGDTLADVDESWLTSVIEGIKNEYPLGDTFSVAVNIPENQDIDTLQQVFQDDPPDKVKQTVSGGQVYHGTRVVAAAQSEAVSQVLKNIQPFIKSSEGNFLIIYSEVSHVGRLVQQMQIRTVPLLRLTMSLRTGKAMFLLETRLRLLNPSKIWGFLNLGLTNIPLL